MNPKFTLSKTESIHVGETYISNGHWMLKRSAIDPRGDVGKALKPILNLRFASYCSGYSDIPSTSPLPEFETIIPKRDGFIPAEDYAIGAEVAQNDRVLAYLFKAGEMTFGVNPKYIPLMRLGYAHCKTPNDPILILDSRDLNGEFIGVVMPIRLKRGES